jgi:hypothetical protein
MTSRDFCYWLQGYFEVNGAYEDLEARKVDMIRKHLDLVFKHEIDPSFPAEQQDALNEIHNSQPAFNHSARPDGLVARC